MRPLRIAYLLASLRPGGAERQMLLLAEELPKDHFVVDFLVMIGPGDYDDRARRAGARVIPLGLPPVQGESPLAGLRRRVGMTHRLLQAVRRGRYDIIDAWLYPADALAALSRPLTRTPVVISGRRNLDLHARFGPMTGIADRVVDRLTDAVVANSKAAADNAVRNHHVDPSRLHVIRNGVELVEEPSPEVRVQRRQELGVADDQLLIACVGNYRSVKRHELLIEAFAAVAGDAPDARLLLIGEGPMRGDIERQVAEDGLTDRVIIHGPLLDVRPYYPAFDIVVQASRSEGLPNVLLEAASAGRAIVATDAGGSSEVIIDGHTGILVPTEDASALAFGIQRLIDDVTLRSTLGRAAREHVAANFGVARLAWEFGSLYQALATTRARGSTEIRQR